MENTEVQQLHHNYIHLLFFYSGDDLSLNKMFVRMILCDYTYQFMLKIFLFLFVLHKISTQVSQTLNFYTFLI